jgi:trans-2-enoyl-CoA reductase
MLKALAIRFHEFGPPAQVAHLQTVDVTDPGPGQVRIRMEAAPIHPADLNRLEGRYGESPTLPATGGIEGCGRIEAIGTGVMGLEPGTRVALAHAGGTWCERLVTAADRVFPLPPDIDRDLAATLLINPLTAWLMLHSFVPLEPGEWVLFNAANSAVGRSLIEIARAEGLRSLAVVRRPEVIPDLTHLGADAVILDDDRLRESVRERTTAAPIRLALNAVGGSSALRLANALATGGTLVTYGAMGRRPVELPNGLLIFKDLRARGFWLNRWFRETPEAERQRTLQTIAALAAAGRLSTKVAATYPLSEVQEALTTAAQDRREGKVLFRMNSSAESC